MKKYLYLIFILLPLIVINFFNRKTETTKEPTVVEYAHAETTPPYYCSCDYCNCTANDASCASGDGSGGSGDSGVGGDCFTAGTLVSTPNGDVAIESIKVGDPVLAYDPSTGEQIVSFVTETISHPWDENKDMSPLINITHESGTLSVTTNHQIFMKGKVSKEGNTDFINAGELAVGDTLTLIEGNTSNILSIESVPKYDVVYNIEVDRLHTYVAQRVLVHNKY